MINLSDEKEHIKTIIVYLMILSWFLVNKVNPFSFDGMVSNILGSILLSNI